MRRNQKRIIWLLSFSTALAVASLVIASLHRPKIFGHLSTGDLSEISRVIHHDLRRYELPTFSKQNLNNPRYVLASVKQYAGRRILWVNVEDEHTVRAYVGDSKETIASDGWSYVLRKDRSWRIGGAAYWGSAELAPRDFKVPAGL